MKSFLLFPVLLSLICSSCKNGMTSKEEVSCNLSGSYINKTKLEHAPGSYGKDQVEANYYALELSFNEKDSVEVNNGFEKFKLPYTAANKKCTYKLIGATQLGDMTFEVLNDSVITLMDTAWTNTVTPATFTKAHKEDGQTWSYENHLNNAVLGGTYTYLNDKGKNSTVRFLPNGQVQGLKPYLSYSLCYAGDCLGETEPPSGTIEFSHDTGGKDLFAIQISDDGEIKFFKVADPVPDIKGERAVGDLAFVIKKQSE